jgi:hypothetical protein
MTPRGPPRSTPRYCRGGPHLPACPVTPSGWPVRPRSAASWHCRRKPARRHRTGWCTSAPRASTQPAPRRRVSAHVSSSRPQIFPMWAASRCCRIRRVQRLQCSPLEEDRPPGAHPHRARSRGTSWRRRMSQRRCAFTGSCSAGPRAPATTWEAWGSINSSSTVGRRPAGYATCRVRRPPLPG